MIFPVGRMGEKETGWCDQRRQPANCQSALQLKQCRSTTQRRQPVCCVADWQSAGFHTVAGIRRILPVTGVRGSA